MSSEAKTAPACTLVIFGARGDLAKRLLVPALYNLRVAGLLDESFKIIGVDHGDSDDQAWRDHLSDFLNEVAANPASEFGKAKIDPTAWSWLAERMAYQKGDFEDPKTYAALGSRLVALGDGDTLFYLATAPRFFGEVADQLGRAGLLKPRETGFRRLVIEKPFGDDLATAK